MAVLVLVGKSGSGKSRIERELASNFRYEKAVSTTTREIRNGEVDGIDYHFVNDEEFNKMMINDKL